MLNKAVVVILLLVLALMIYKRDDLMAAKQKFENFDATGQEFIHQCSPVRYGLRGDPLRQVDIANYYHSPYRQMYVGEAGSMLFEGTETPDKYCMEDKCVKVPCVSHTGEFDSMDTCWKC